MIVVVRSPARGVVVDSTAGDAGRDVAAAAGAFFGDDEHAAAASNTAASNHALPLMVINHHRFQRCDQTAKQRVAVVDQTVLYITPRTAGVARWTP